MINNITLDTDCPQAARLPKFFVTALEDIKPPYVVTGDLLMIDPDAMETGHDR